MTRLTLCRLNAGWLWLAALLFGTTLHAQDPVFSQFWSNKLYLNPAYTGYEDGMNVYSSYRNQWVGVGGNRAQFTSQAIGLSQQLPDHKIGIGGQYVESNEGQGPLRWQKFEFDFAWRSRSCNKNVRDTWEINLGAGISHNIWTYREETDLVFSDQLDGRLGLVQARSAFWQGGLDFEQNQFTDFSLGGVLAWEYDRRVVNEVGIAMQHLFPQRNQSVIGAQNYRPLRVGAHWLGQVQTSYLSGALKYYPVARVEIQPMAYRDPAIDSTRRMSWNYQLGAAADLTNGVYGIWAGAWWQGRRLLDFQRDVPIPFSVNSAIIGVGMRGPLSGNPRSGAYWNFGATYDYQYSNGGVFNDGGGIVEFQLGIHFNEFGLFGNTCKKCPIPGF